MKNQSLINRAQKFYTKIVYEMLKDKLFQPIGLELTVTPVVFTTKEDYDSSDNSKDFYESLPPAYYRPDTDSIHIFLEHPMFPDMNNDQNMTAVLFFLMYHEANHRLLMHTNRIAKREHNLWNIAADYEIHNMFYVYKSLNIPKKSTDKIDINSIFIVHQLQKIDSIFFNEEKPLALFDECYLDNVAEEIYQDLMNSKKQKTKEMSISLCTNAGDSGNGQGNESDDEQADANSNNSNDNKQSNESNGNGKMKVKVVETTFTTKSGKTHKSTTIVFPKGVENMSGKSNEQKKSDENNALVRKTLMENVVHQTAKSRGLSSEKCALFLKKLFRVKVDWEKILRNSLRTVLEKSDDFAWHHPRTSLFALSNMPYLPAQVEAPDKYGTLIVARDESGSMSDEEVAKAAGIIADAKDYYKKIILIKHDTKIASVNEFEYLTEEGIEILKTRATCGGTSHKDVNEWILKYSQAHRDEETISCVIYITDLESDLEETQKILPSKIPTIYLAPINSVARYENVIKGKIIPVEL